MAAAGQNREAHGNLEAYVLEGTWRLEERWSVYSRAEYVAKDILDAGFHPVGMGHTHRQSPVGAFTIGATRYLLTGIWGTLGLGADVTGYSVPANLQRGVRIAGVVARVRALSRPGRHLGDDPPPALSSRQGLSACELRAGARSACSVTRGSA